MEKIRVGFFIGSMYGGGAERAMLYLLQHLNPERFAKYLFLFKNEGPYLDHVPSDVDVRAIQGNNPFHKLRSLHKEVSEIQPDLMVSMLDSPNRYILRYKFLINRSLNVVVVEQNNLSKNIDLKYKGLKKILTKFEIKTLYKAADRIVCVSKGIALSLSSEFKIKSKKLEVINNPVDIDRILEMREKESSIPIPNGYTLVCVGRLVPQKSQEDLIRAMSVVLKTTNCNLLLLGDGPKREALQVLIDNLDISNSVQICGFVENPWSVISRCDLFVSSSRWEGFPLGHIEALACGVPILSTDCPYGPDEIVVSGRNGELVEVGNISQMAKSIVSLLEDQNKLNFMKSNTTENLEKHGVEIFIESFEQLIFKTITANG